MLLIAAVGSRRSAGLDAWAHAGRRGRGYYSMELMELKANARATSPIRGRNNSPEVGMTTLPTWCILGVQGEEVVKCNTAKVA
jgi:hypothetical protein